MSRIVVAYHSGYGHTAKLAEAVIEGARAAALATVTPVVIDAMGEVPASAWDDMTKADAIIFGSPTYMATVSWQFKKFADASSKIWASQAWKNKLAAGFTNSASMNGDKHSTLQYLIAFSMQHGMLWVGSGLMPANRKDSARNDVNFLGAFSGLMSQSPADASPEEAPPPGDLETARLFAVRVAEAADRLRSL